MQLYWNENAGMTNGYNKVGNWLTGANVSSGTAPTAADTVNLSAGFAAVGAAAFSNTVNLSGTGLLSIGHYGVLNAATLNVSGGEFNASSGGLPPVFVKGPQGIANISALVNVSGGLLDNYGVLNVLSGGAFQQSGGTVEQLFIATPVYTLSGGTLAGGVVGGRAMAATITATNFTQTGGAMGGNVTTTGYDQSGGTMTGTVFASTYALSGTGSLSGTANFSTAFGLSGSGVVESSAQLIGSSATMTQTGGEMGGDVTTTGYDQSGGTLAGSGVVNFSGAYKLSGTGVVETGALLRGGPGSTVAQSGGTMGGNVTGLTNYTQAGGSMTGTMYASTYQVSGDGDLSGVANFSTAFTLSGSGVVQSSAQLLGSSNSTIAQTGGEMRGTASGISTYDQSGGTLAGSGLINFSGAYKLSNTGVVETGALLRGGPGSTVAQSGGAMDGQVTGLATYTQSGGSFEGSLSTLTFDLTSGSAGSSGTIAATNTFLLEPTSGSTTIGAALSGTGRLVKSGAGTVVLTGTNSFTGGVLVTAGVLEARGGAALPDSSAITIADTAGATLLVTSSETVGSLTGGGIVSVADGATLITGGATNTTFAGTMTGSTGGLEKRGGGTFTLSGGLMLGALSVDEGELAIGDGSSTNTASFESAVIASGATLYVAHGATLIIRVPDDIVNNGHLINDGTVNDDLANASLFDNNMAYNANVISNTGTINNNAPGVWTGDVLSNDNTIINSNTAHWIGDLVTNAGTIVNNGFWSGDVRGNSGYLQNAVGSWTGRVLGNSAHINNYAGGSWTGAIVANGTTGQIRSDAPWNGSITGNAGQIFNYNVWTNGDIIANAGSITNDGYPDGATWNGNVLGNDGQVVNDNGALWNGAIEGNNSAILNDANSSWNGAVTGNGGGSNGLAQIDNRGVWTGSVTSNAGRIINENGGTWNGNVLGNAGTITTQGVWNGSFSNAGTVEAQNRINGTFINSGLLQLTGSLAGITALTNNGTLDLRGAAAAQTLTATTVNFGAGSVYGIDIDSAGHNDSVVATTVSLGGTVRVMGMATGGAYSTMSHYTIVSAQNITGTFSGVTTDLAFLDPRLSYVDPNVVALDMVRNNQGFSQVGETPNEKSAAAAAAALGTGNSIFGAVLWLTNAQAAQAFDALSGEAYASFASASVENANLIAKAITGHVDQAFDAIGGDSTSASGYTEPYTPAASATKTAGLWGDFYGVHADVATRGFAAMSSTTGGVTVGLDGVLGTWRLGLALQAGTTGMVVQDLGTTANSFDYGGGVYAGTEWGNTRLSLGALYSRHDIQSSRNVAFPGFAETLAAGYSSGTAQAFAELSHEFGLGAVSLRPFANLTYVRQATDAFTETGGTAALSNPASLIDATFATLGFSVDRQFVVADTMLLTASGSLGWRHAFASTPSVTNAFSGGAGFTVLGTPIVADMFVLSASLDLDVSAATTLDLTYNGQNGSGAQSHALRATWNTRF